jgi:hypothetical protein
MTTISHEHLGSMLAEAHALQTQISSSTYSHDVLELAIATAISFRLSHHTGTSPVWLLTVGAPSGDKTNTIGNLRKAPSVMFIDSLTENGLASGYVDPDGKTKRQDVLSQLTLGCLVIKDLTTLFSMRPERVRKILGEFSTIFDGEFIKPSGAGEGVAWDGHFSFLGCITPQCLAQHYRYMGKIGGRFLLYRIPRQSDEERAAGFTRIKTDRKPVKQALAHTVRNLVGAALQATVAMADGHDGRERYHCILLLMDGKSCSEIAQWLYRDEDTIRGWVHAFNQSGLQGLEREAIPGRPA